jgi:hypothetical protein
MFPCPQHFASIIAVEEQKFLGYRGLTALAIATRCVLRQQSGKDCIFRTLFRDVKCSRLPSTIAFKAYPCMYVCMYICMHVRM